MTELDLKYILSEMLDLIAQMHCDPYEYSRMQEKFNNLRKYLDSIKEGE